MAFSIVITTFNRLEWLKRAVDSALAQTLPAQVVIADNASTDGTEAYVKSLGSRIVYVRNATNLHHAGAVNAGIKAATGDWIKLLDDDDYLAPTCLEVMADALARHPQAVICSCQAAQVDSGGHELSRTAAWGPGRVFYIPQAAIHYGMLLEQVPFGTPVQVAIRRDALLQSGGWDVTMTSCDDIDSWVRVAEYGDAVFINDCLSYRTLWPGGFDQKIQLQQRLETNILIKSRIHRCVSDRYRPQIPPLPALAQYLHLHWGLVALKHRQLGTAFTLGRPGLLSIPAWQILLKARRQRQGAANPSPVPKIVIIQ